MARKRRFTDEERDHILRAATNKQPSIHPVWKRLWWDRNLAKLMLHGSELGPNCWQLVPHPDVIAQVKEEQK